MSLNARFSKLAMEQRQKSAQVGKKPMRPKDKPAARPRARQAQLQPVPRGPANSGAMRDKRSLYATAMLDPISGPLVGVPTTVPIPTFVTRVKATAIMTVSTGLASIFCQPTYMMSSNGPGGYVGAAFVASNSIGAIHGTAASTFGAFNGVGGFNGLSNAPFSASDFTSTTSSVRGRVVGCIFRICNTSSANTRNGTFTTYVEPAHNSLQDVDSAKAATYTGACRYPANTSDWHTIAYHPVDPDEVEGWVVNPMSGPLMGVRSGAYASGATVLDGTVSDTLPGYMGIWWNGDTTTTQTFLLEAHAIVEYVGTKVQPMLRDNPAEGEVAHHAHNLVSKAASWVTSNGTSGSGHPIREHLGKFLGTAADVVRDGLASRAGKSALKYAFAAESF